MITKFKLLAAAALIASPVLATQAQATTAIYTITGTGTEVISAAAVVRSQMRRLR